MRASHNRVSIRLPNLIRKKILSAEKFDQKSQPYVIKHTNTIYFFKQLALFICNEFNLKCFSRARNESVCVFFSLFMNPGNCSGRRHMIKIHYHCFSLDMDSMVTALNQMKNHLKYIQYSQCY